MDHFSTLNSAPSAARSFVGRAKPAQLRSTGAVCHQLAARQAKTLRARQLSVLRITHGRVWATLTDAGPYSRVPGGDHFLSRGQSLTLLPGQELVMEPFVIDHSPAAQFSWETACAEPIAVPEASQYAAGLRQARGDLRHALGLVAGASASLVQGLFAGAWGAAGSAVGAVLNRFAILFIARKVDCTSTPGAFDAKNGPY